MSDFIYYKHDTPVGIRVEEIYDDQPTLRPPLWRKMAYQIFSEHGKNEYRELGTFPSGAPFLFNSDCRISVTHTARLLAVASLPPTPETNLSEYNPRTAMGIDAESSSREQARKCRERFLNNDELTLIGDDLQKCVLAWTIKEAVYKAALIPGLDFKNNLIINSLPTIHCPDGTPFYDAMLGKAIVRHEQGNRQFSLYSYLSEEYIITIAFSEKCAKYKKQF